MKLLIGLGANLGDPLDTLREALAALAAVPHIAVTQVSSFYRTEPVDCPLGAPAFVNAVAELTTDLTPEGVLGVCLGIEAAFGRVRSVKNAPRTLDLDLLLTEDGQPIQTKTLTLPHPRMTARGFVLVPFEELFPDGQFGANDLTAALRSVDRRGVSRLSTD